MIRVPAPASCVITTVTPSLRAQTITIVLTRHIEFTEKWQSSEADCTSPELREVAAIAALKIYLKRKLRWIQNKRDLKTSSNKHWCIRLLNTRQAVIRYTTSIRE